MVAALSLTHCMQRPSASHHGHGALRRGLWQVPESLMWHRLHRCCRTSWAPQVMGLLSSVEAVSHFPSWPQRASKWRGVKATATGERSTYACGWGGDGLIVLLRRACG